MRIFRDIAAPSPSEKFFDFIHANLGLLLLIVGAVAAVTVVLIVLLKKNKRGK